MIGTDATGLLARGNKGEGVLLDTTKDNIVGTDGDGANDLDEGNIIAANGANGIRIFASQAIKVAGNIIAQISMERNHWQTLLMESLLIPALLKTR